MAPKISVVIPVYNSQKHIIETLDSIKAQSITDYEVIMVNDGSVDNSRDIITQYISENGLLNFYLINKENGGVSSARNVGLSKARGEWIFFLDSDDWIEPECFKTLLDVGNNSRADLIIGGYQMCNQVTGSTEIWSNFPCNEGHVPEDIHNLHSFSFIWGKLYKKDIIDKHGLRFDERIKYAEDNAWQLDYIKSIQSFAYSHDIIYNYRFNSSEQFTSRLITPEMKRHRWEHLQDFLEAFDKTDVAGVLNRNPRFLSVTWGILTDAVVLDILDKKPKDAKEKLKSQFSKLVISAFSPRSKKETFFLFLYKHSFTLLRAFVLMYYKNFDKLRQSKLLKLISKRK